MQLEGKRIVVTGSSVGIGQAVALKLAREGARVVVNGRNADSLQATLELIRRAGGQAVASCGSVADYDYCCSLIQTCVDSWGGIDGLINCAGIVEPKGSSILSISPDDWRALIDIHLGGTFNTCRQAAPLMVRQGHGMIVNTCSHAFLGVYGGTGYAAGKGGIYSLTMAMAMDLKEHGISVNAVCPGGKTRISSGTEFEEQIKALNRRGLLSDDLASKSLDPPSPDHVAALYAYLVSDAAAGITARAFWGAGGYLGQFHMHPDQLLAMKNVEHSPPWTAEELDRILGKPSFRQPEKIHNLLIEAGPVKLSVRQQTLLNIANSRFVQMIQRVFKPA